MPATKRRDRYQNLNLSEKEWFIIESWYALTHENSIDSYRFKSMNSRLIIKELYTEILSGRLKIDELKGIATEAKLLLEKDPVIISDFTDHYNLVKKKLDTIINNKDKKREIKKSTIIYLDEFNDKLLDSYYKKCATKILEYYDTGSAEYEKIYLVIQSVLSDMIDYGWSIESLFMSHWHFLKHDQTSFKQKLEKLFNILSRPPRTYRVMLRLSGSKKIEKISDFDGIKIIENFPLPKTKDLHGVTSKIVQFKPNDYVFFAESEEIALDTHAAGGFAKERIEKILDLLRFGFLNSRITIGEYAFIEREIDKRIEISRLEISVPNPLEDESQSYLEIFIKNYRNATQANKLDQGSQRRIEAALQFYRLGRDSITLRDKFIHWWQGLEVLTDIENNGIGNSAIKYTCLANLSGYAKGLVNDTRVTIKYLNRGNKYGLNEYYGVNRNSRIEYQMVLDKLISDDLSSGKIAEMLETNQYFKLIYMKLHKDLSSPDFAEKMIKNHKSMVEWQIARLWRIRCYLVHASPNPHKLVLYTSNLEYYLKKLLMYILENTRNQKITSIKDIYYRTELSYENCIKSLSEGSGNFSNPVFSISTKIL
jgi:hypothetical protein